MSLEQPGAAVLMLLYPLHITHTLHRYPKYMKFSSYTVRTCACVSLWIISHVTAALSWDFWVAGALYTTSGYLSLPRSRVLLPVFISSRPRLTELKRDVKMVITLTTDSSVRRVTEWASFSMRQITFCCRWKAYHTFPLVFISPLVWKGIWVIVWRNPHLSVFFPLKGIVQHFGKKAYININLTHWDLYEALLL